MTLSLNRSYKTMDAFWLIFRTSPLWVVLHVALSITHAIMPTAATALATANFVDTAMEVLNGARPYGDITLPFVMLLVVLGLFTTITSIIRLIEARIRLELQRKLKPSIVETHAALDFKHIESTESWELISRVSRDPVKSVMDGFGAIIQLIQIVVSVTSVLTLVVMQVWWAAIIIVAFSVPMFWLSMYAGRKNYQAGRDAEKFNRRTEYLDEVLSGRENIDERTLFGYGEEISRRWQQQYEAGRKLKLKVTAKMFLITKGSSMVLALIAILVALTLIQPVLLGQLSPGMFMGIVGAVFGMIQKLGWQMSYALEEVSAVGEYMKDFTEFTKLSWTENSLGEPDMEPIDFKSLEFRNVRFRYPNPSSEGFVLNGLSFTLEAGKHYAFVGKNGAGKTTVTKLLTGLYTDYEGEILVNGIELRKYPISTLKALFSVVFQDFSRYYISLKDNILLGDVAGATEGTDDRIIEAAAQAGLNETIGELKNGIDTPLGKILEGGQDISGGQWQRVAIARSLNNRAPVKILDEPTAALDPISESRLYEEFERLMGKKTTILISHRLGSTKLADEILIIDEGRIAECGTHSELIAMNGRYADMFEAQRGWYQ